MDGKRINSCLPLAVASRDKKITTIEGLVHGDDLHPMQASFLAHDGFQCGYCTPGQIVSAVALLGEPVGPTDADVCESMSGNLCRCGAYPNILAAIQEIRAAKGNKRGARRHARPTTSCRCSRIRRYTTRTSPSASW